VAQVVEYLPSKYKVLSLNASNGGKKTKKPKKNKEAKLRPHYQILK
jgi:hypothetical protein